MDTRLFAFVGGDSGLWRIVGTETIVGKSLPEAKRLNVISASELQPETNAPWVLRGITSNERYVMREEKNEIVVKQQGLARPEATCAALIPIRKNAAWWEFTQDERRSVFEKSKHIQIGLNGQQHRTNALRNNLGTRSHHYKYVFHWTSLLLFSIFRTNGMRMVSSIMEWMFKSNSNSKRLFSNLRRGSPSPCSWKC